MIRADYSTESERKSMKEMLMAAIAAVAQWMGMALAYTLAAGTAGAVLLLVVLIVAMKDKEERERKA